MVETHPIFLYTFIGIFAEGSPATDDCIDDSAATNPENTSIREGKRCVICSMMGINSMPMPTF